MRPRHTDAVPHRTAVAVHRRPAGRGQRPAGLLVVRTAGSALVTVRRLPLDGAGRYGPGEVVDEHVNTALAAGSPRPEVADVLVLGCAHRPALALRTARGALERFPGCLVAAVPTADGGCVAAARGGRQVTVTPADGQRAPTEAELAVVASCLHTELVLGGNWADLAAICLSAPSPRAPRHGRMRFRPGPVPPADPAADRRLSA
ncbi:hypothetical protein [Actinacidiphila sp. bgisy144]|uniref:hypothetical protein n=1 Tax=unclassified Actinacidiphila TaxID=2995708 RepID=UPI003EBB54E9